MEQQHGLVVVQQAVVDVVQPVGPEPELDEQGFDRLVEVVRLAAVRLVVFGHGAVVGDLEVLRPVQLVEVLQAPRIVSPGNANVRNKGLFFAQG